MSVHKMKRERGNFSSTQLPLLSSQQKDQWNSFVLPIKRIVFQI